MDFLKQLKALRDANQPMTSYLTFMQQYKKGESSLHIFYEGDDDPSFYTNFIETFLGNKPKLFYYNCKNKKGVSDTYVKINWQTYKKKRALFFVDKDHEDLINAPSIKDINFFITKYYSIENYLVNETILHRTLRELISINDQDMILQISSKFELQLQKFIELIDVITSWILYHKKKGLEVKLLKVKMQQIFYFNDNLEIKRYKKPQSKKILNYLDEKTGINTPNNAWKEIISILRNLKTINYKIHLRGKFEIWFFVNFIEKLVEGLNNDIPEKNRRYKIKSSLSISNAVAILGTRLSIPVDFKTFLNNLFSSTD